jgi:hypothetical protein
MDESILSLLALLPGTDPGAVTLFYPRTGRSSRAPLENHGIERTAVNGEERQLEHLTLGTGEQIKHLWYDTGGRLIKIEVPSDDLTAVRSSRH